MTYKSLTLIYFRVEVNETVRKVQKWVTTATNAIDSEDAKLVEQVGCKPSHEKTCLLRFGPGLMQTRLYSHRRWLEA